MWGHEVPLHLGTSCAFLVTTSLILNKVKILYLHYFAFVHGSQWTGGLQYPPLVNEW